MKKKHNMIIILIISIIIVIIGLFYLKSVPFERSPSLVYPEQNNLVNMVNLTRDDAFQKLKKFLSEDLQQSNIKSIYPEILEIAKLQKSSDSVARFKAVEPSLTTGKNLIAPSSDRLVGFRVIFGKESDLRVDHDYWVFAWYSPGVIDHGYTFYVDSNTGDVALVAVYESPD